MIDEIIALEWAFFQEVNNIDGRATCQDDYDTFYIMRSSQFKAWYLDVTKSYLDDLKLYQQLGRNPIMEKYARMMEYTDYEYYRSIENQLPIIDDQFKEIIKVIVNFQVIWREEFNNQYPRIASSSRSTYSANDVKDDTSFETYLRGELLTYSKQTIILYGQMIVDMFSKEINITSLITMYIVKQYGYCSLEVAEEKIT